ncbi:MAG: tetratricopeptide repeat protein, partial [Hymenobacter sp.]|nr:tetratricopeptide repeat protein [Hymenobacter sp.]
MVGEAHTPAAVAAPTHPATARHPLRSEQQLLLGPAAALLEGKQALHLAPGGGLTTDRAAAYVAIGEAFLAQHHYEQALTHFKQGLRVYQQLNDQVGRARVLRQVGRARYAQGDTGQAHDTYQQALRLAGQLRNPAEMAQNYGCLGELYGSQQLWARALASHERAYTEWQRAGNPAGQAAALNDIGL